MIKISFIYFKSCPHSKKLLDSITEIAANRPDIQLSIHEHSDKDFPNPLKWWGSPSIVIDGFDLFGAVKADHPACRLYKNGIPNTQSIENQINKVAGI
jgi:hypothetical protein